MQKRRLGNQGLEVSALGLGCVGMSWMYGNFDDPASVAESVATLHHAISLGITLLDTAEVYGPFKNETLLGEALKGRRDEVILSTKVGFAISEAGEIAGVDSSPGQVKRAVEGSLQRLQTDHIDLLYQHQPDPSVPIEDTIGAMADLVREGKVRFVGLSNASVEMIRRAHATHPISALQSEYSLWERGLEPEIRPVLAELDIGLVPYSPLGRGFITGAAKRAEDYPEGDFRRTHPRFQGENFDRNMAIVDNVRAVAERRGATVSQIALAWLLAKGPDVVPIPGTKRRTYLEENAASATIELTPAEVSELDAIAAPALVAGSRFRPGEGALFDDF